MKAIADAVKYADTVIETVECFTDWDKLEVLTELLTDLMHWSEARDVNFKRAVKSAKKYWITDKKEQGVM